MKNTITFSETENKINVYIGNNRELELNRESTGNCFELVLSEGEELDVAELKVLNALGFVYHSEQTDIDFENEDGTTSYMNIYYFARVDIASTFTDCMPY